MAKRSIQNASPTAHTMKALAWLTTSWKFDISAILHPLRPSQHGCVHTKDWVKALTAVGARIEKSWIFWLNWLPFKQLCINAVNSSALRICLKSPRYSTLTKNFGFCHSPIDMHGSAHARMYAWGGVCGNEPAYVLECAWVCEGV